MMYVEEPSVLLVRLVLTRGRFLALRRQDDEIEICNEYQSKEQEVMDFDLLVQELGLDE